MNEFVINISELSKTYHSQHVLHDVNLKVRPGETLAIMGASGSGKSTLLAILGLLTQDFSGHYALDDINIAQLSSDQLAEQRSKTIGFIFQSFLLLPTLSALENVLLPTYYSSSANTQEYALELLRHMNMQAYAHCKPNQLSGGQQQRVAIARALINKPKLILADEPTGSLDHDTGHEVMNQLLKLNNQQAISLVIVTHTAEIAQRCSRVVHLENGQLS